MALFGPISLYLPKTPEALVIQAYASYSKEKRAVDLQLRPNSFLSILRAGTEANTQEAQWQYIAEAFQAACNAKRFVAHPANYWVLRRKSKRGVFTGLITGMTAAAVKGGKLRPHEATLPDRAATLGGYLTAVKIQAEPVVAAFSSAPPLQDLLEEVTHHLPLHEFSYDAVTYTLWPLNARQSAACHHALAAIDHCDLVDGHHRAEAVIHYSNQTENSSNTQLLTLLVPAEQIQSESFFWSLPQLPSEISLEALSRLGSLQPLPKQLVPSKKHPLLLLLEGTPYSLHPHNSTLDSLQKLYQMISATGVQLLYHPRKKDQALTDFTAVTPSAFCCSYLPLPFALVQQLTANGKTVPPKTTFLHPKLLTGHLVHPMQ